MVIEEWNNAAANMMLNQDYKDPFVSDFELADRMNLVGDSFDRGGKKDIPCGIVVHL
jgi:hypothetical protein